MGRQTAVALSETDERDLLTFLRKDADIQIVKRAASSPELLFVSEFPPRGPNQYYFHLWNTAFPWQPEFGQLGLELREQRPDSQFYLKNTAGAPIIEYYREPFENPGAIGSGRVYWDTDFAIYRGPHYDTRAFGLWYDKVVRWLRKNGQRVELARGWYQYWLPGAWQLRTSIAERSHHRQ